MGLDIRLEDPTATYDSGSLYDTNITHNLGKMAAEAGIYEALWRPYRLDPNYNRDWDGDHELEWEFEENCTVIAESIIPIIEKGLQDMKEDPDYYKLFDSPNGWGTYEDFVPFVEEYLEALQTLPKAIVIADR